MIGEYEQHADALAAIETYRANDGRWEPVLLPRPEPPKGPAPEPREPSPEYLPEPEPVREPPRVLEPGRATYEVHRVTFTLDGAPGVVIDQIAKHNGERFVCHVFREGERVRDPGPWKVRETVATFDRLAMAEIFVGSLPVRKRPTPKPTPKATLPRLATPGRPAEAKGTFYKLAKVRFKRTSEAGHVISAIVEHNRKVSPVAAFDGEGRQLDLHGVGGWRELQTWHGLMTYAAAELLAKEAFGL